MDGINKQIPLTPAFDANLYEADAAKINSLTLIPENLGVAIELAQKSTFVQRVLPLKTIDKFLSSKRVEWNSYTQAENKEQFEKEKYFLKV